MDESSLVAAAFPFFFGAAAFPLGTAAFGVVSFGAVASFLGSGAAFGCVAARRLRSGFDVDAAAVTVALALLLLLLLLGDTVAPVTGLPPLCPPPPPPLPPLCLLLGFLSAT